MLRPPHAVPHPANIGQHGIYGEATFRNAEFMPLSSRVSTLRARPGVLNQDGNSGAGRAAYLGETDRNALLGLGIPLLNRTSPIRQESARRSILTE